jgi:rSAM/selenodomain-associated transferase 2
VAVSVVIPAWNEEERIGAAIASAFAAGASEVIVSDGGSSDATLAVAAGAGARTLTSERVRAKQLDAGARAATYESIVFLHADTLLPPGAAHWVERSLAGGACFGGFRIAFIEGGLRLRYVAFMINARTRLTRAPWGDQAQFTRRDTLLRIGGYGDAPIMEDYELARRMKRVGPVEVLPLTVQTSGRRFLARGVIATSILNWLIVAAWHLGVPPQKLAAWYRGRAR